MVKKKPIPILAIASIFVLAFLAAFFPLCGAAGAAENALYKGDIVYTEPVKSVVFSHELHVVKRGLGCDRCHSGLFAPAAYSAQGKGDFTMASFSKGKYCGACHNGRTAFASDSQCARCHAGVKGARAYARTVAVQGVALVPPGGPIRIGEGDVAVQFSHKVHTQIFGCSECHSGMFPMSKGRMEITMAGIDRGKQCGSCHNGKKAFAASQCGRCHAKVPAPKASLVYTAKGMKKAAFSHALHTQMFKCADCHTKRFKMQKGGSGMKMDPMYNGKYCGGCHNGKTAFAVTDCDKCHNR
ncbi:MAG: hypothetical protein M0Z75_15805 [Nitrospiraceae bacterium]|nr:hypothetical protein [Nitrospiraceae bacterium]